MQNADAMGRATGLQGVVYGFFITGFLWVLMGLFDVTLDSAYQLLLSLVFVLSLGLFRPLDLTIPWAIGQPGSIGSRAMVRWGWMVGIILLLGLATKTTEVFSRYVMMTWFVTTPLLLIGLHIITRYGVLRAAPQLVRRRTAILVFANDTSRRLSERLSTTSLYQVLGFFEDREPDRTGGGVDALPLLGKARNAAQYVKDNNVEVVFVVLPDEGSRRALQVIDTLGDTTASVYYVPDFLMFNMLKSEMRQIEGMAVLQVAETPFYGVDGVLKRVFDIAFSSFAMLLLAPVFLGLSIAVKMSSTGPVFFKQKRYGLNGKRFWVYKFRSMRENAPSADSRQATRDDDRITRVGRFIRKTSLDELPQFYNALKGEMSVVGPRPHTVAHNESYRREIKRYMIRHKVKPGVTGWAQVNGLRGETANIERMEERIRYDLEYISNWSPWLDLKIVLMTIGLVFKDDNAF